MLSLVLCVVFIIVNVKANEIATENPEIRLSYSKDGNENYTVWKDKPLTIVIEHGYPRYVRCHSRIAQTNHLSDFIPMVELSNNIIAKLYVKRVTAEMSTNWACTVLKPYVAPEKPYYYMGKKFIAKDLYFNLQVRGAKAVVLTANSRSLTYVTTNLSVNYDGEANYTYVEGEDLEISCKMAQDLDGPSTLRLEYYNAADIPLFKTKSRDIKPHLFRTALKSDNNNYYLDCIRATENPRREYRYRTTFLKKKGDLQAASLKNAIILAVNGQELSATFNKDSSYDDYIFKYIDGDILNITCRKKDNTERGPLTLYYYSEKENEQMSPTHRIKSSSVIFENISTLNLNNKTLICVIENTDVLKPFAKILFLHDELCHDIHIQGLARNNILYQYTNDEYQWTIEYQYSVNESLNLTCVSNTGFQKPSLPSPPGSFEWKFKGKYYDSKADNCSTKPSIKCSQQTFKKILDETDNTTKLRCVYFPHGKDQYSAVEIIFRLKPESETEAEADKGVTTSREDSKVPIVPIAVSVGAAIGIITIICLVLWRKRTKRIHLIESEYDNLSNQNDSPIPAFPSQWESNCDDSHYAHIDEGVMEENDTYTTNTDKLYRMPNKRQSNTSENHYTEIDDYLKTKPAGLAANWNSAHPTDFNKEKYTLRGTPSHKSNNTTQHNFCDSKQGTYNKLRHDNSPINKSNENYSNVQKTGKGKTVTFRQMSNDLRPGHNYSEDTSQQHFEGNNRRVKQNSDGHYANVRQDVFMQPENLRKKPNYENHFPQNERSENSDYAEPYDDLEISSKNNFYG